MSKCFTILAAILCVLSVFPQERSDSRNNEAEVVRIVRAEDELRFDKSVKSLLQHPDSKIRARAALAAGRIGDESAIPELAQMLLKDSPEVAQMAAFAIGEIESAKGAASILSVLENSSRYGYARAAAVESAGKISAANPSTEEARALGEAIFDQLELEFQRGSEQDRDVVLKGLTAVIRAKPVDGDYIVAKFITNKDARIRADAANVLARLVSKNFSPGLRAMVLTDEEPAARANAARALGMAEDYEAVNLLLEAAFTDEDRRVRYSAIGALGRIAEKATGNRIVERAEDLFTKMRRAKSRRGEVNELLLISSALGRIMEDTEDERTKSFLKNLGTTLRHRAPEVEVALARVSRRDYAGVRLLAGLHWQELKAKAEALGVVAETGNKKGGDGLRSNAENTLRTYLRSVLKGKRTYDMSYPAVLNAFSLYKSADLPQVLRESLQLDDFVAREAAASILGEQNLSGTPQNVLENYYALRDAFVKAESDELNDAAIASLEGIKKQYLRLKEVKGVSIDLLEPVKKAMNSPDYLVRRRGFSIARELGIPVTDAPNLVRFDEKGKTRLKRVDYKRAVGRRTAKAILTTEKGRFTIEFFPDSAPLTVENFVQLAKSGYYNGLEIHRVVPNFVVQDGDPRGDGSGGPGWHIRCEINQLAYERGTVGMALSGKDTGGSQWFVTHSPQPHLDGGYTVFGRVNEEGMAVVDILERGDIIKRVEIVE